VFIADQVVECSLWAYLIFDFAAFLVFSFASNWSLPVRLIKVISACALCLYPAPSTQHQATMHQHSTAKQSVNNVCVTIGIECLSRKAFGRFMSSYMESSWLGSCKLNENIK